MADLYLYDVETAFQFTKEYYFYSKALNNNLIKSFTAACDIIRDGRLQDMFEGRTPPIMNRAGNYPEIYWEFNDAFIKTFRS